MNIFKTTDNGGLPFVLDDIRFEQEAVREAFLGLVTSWGVTSSDSYTLSGCVVTAGGGGTYNITAGYIALAGEIFKVDAQTTAAVPFGEFLQWEVEETNDPTGLKTFFSAASFDTYKIRRLKANVVASISSLNALTAKTIHQKIAENTAVINGVFTTYDLENSPNLTGNQLSQGNGTTILLDQQPVANSYLKTSVEGKRINLVFEVLNIITKRSDTDGDVYSIVLDLPNAEVFKSGITQYGTAYLDCTSHSSSITGFAMVRTVPGTSKIAFNLRLPQGDAGIFNRQYTMEGAPSKGYVVTASVDQLHTWIIQGSATFELD